MENVMKKNLIFIGVLMLLFSSAGLGVENLDDRVLTNEYRDALLTADSNMDGTLSYDEVIGFTADVNDEVIDFDQRDAEAVAEFSNRELDYYDILPTSSFDEASSNIESFSRSNEELLRRYDDGDGRIGDGDIFGAVQDWQEDMLEDNELRKMMAARTATELGDYNYLEYISEEPREASIGESVEVSEGDEIIFGSENSNSIEVNNIREYEPGSNSKFFEFFTGQGSEERIVYDEEGSSGSMYEVGFETGDFSVHVEEISAGSDEAVIRIERDLSESSSFDCENYELSENQYAFCKDDGESAVKEVDLGHTVVELEYMYNNRAYGSGEGVAATFDGEDGITLTVTNRGQEYRQAELDIVEWRGLRQEHSGADQQAIIEVDPVRNPEASIDVNRHNLGSGDSFKAVFEAYSEGKYRLEVEGAGISREIDFDESQNSDEISFNPENSGEVNLRLVAPGSWWNPLDSDRVIDEEEVTVEGERESSREYSFGEKFTISEGENVNIEGRNFYVIALGSDVLLWKEERSSDSSAGINLLDDPTNMDYRYSDRFEAYGYLCDLSSDEASVVIDSEEKNPWEVCERSPSELRGDQEEYDVKDYDLGEKTTVSEGEALSFGESRVYIDDIGRSGGIWKVNGYKEWIGETTDYSAGSIGLSSTDWFYEGDIASTTCGVEDGEATIVMKYVDDVGSDWPESHCEEDSSDSSGDLSVTEASGTPSWRDVFSVSAGETVSPVYWGEGFEVVDSTREDVQIRDLQTDETVLINSGEASTLYQDYVVHYCGTDGSSQFAVTSGSEETSEICPEDSDGSDDTDDSSGDDDSDDSDDDSGDDSSEDSITVNELQDTVSWSDNIEVSEGTTLAPVYWGEGFKVETIEEERLNLVSVSGEEDITVGEGNMRTFYQDYVVHACEVGSGEASISLTPTQEPHGEVCGEESSSDSIEAEITTSGSTVEISGSMEVPDPCFSAEATEFNVEEGAVNVLIEPVNDDSGRICASVISEASIDVSRELEPGSYSVTAEIIEEDGERAEVSRDVDLSGETVDIQVDMNPEDPSITDEVELSAGPEGYNYEWDTDGDEEYEREGSQITMSFEEAGSKEISVRTRDSLTEVEETVSFDVSNPDIDSSLTVSKDEVSLAEPVMIDYSVGEAVSRNGYRLEIENPNGDVLMEKGETSRSGSERFIPGNDAVTGTYTASLVANNGFLSSILRSIFGPEAEASFQVVDESESVSEWRSYCDENGYDHESASGRVSCIDEKVGPECFTSNPDSECREVAESVCQYYRGTSFNADKGRCN